MSSKIFYVPIYGCNKWDKEFMRVLLLNNIKVSFGIFKINMFIRCKNNTVLVYSYTHICLPNLNDIISDLQRVHFMGFPAFIWRTEEIPISYP